MRFHFIGDRTERLFSKGQRFLDRWLFEEAIELFNRAIDTDPFYAHIYLYKGIALAELGRYEEAIIEIQKGAHMSPGSFVFPMFLGCVHLDEGEFDAAEAAFKESSSLASTNSLVMGYQMLTAFLKGDRSVLARLHSTLMIMPEAFKSRLLVSLGYHEHIVVPPGSIPASEIKADAGANAMGCHPFFRFRFLFLGWRVRRLMGASKYERVIELLQNKGELNSTLASLLQEARGYADKELTSQLDSLEGKSVVSGRKQIGRQKLNCKIEEQRRSLLLRLADLHEADSQKRFLFLKQWVESFQSAGRPKRLQHFASGVLTEMAELALGMGHLNSAISLCQESRAMGCSPEVDWVEGFAALAAGNQRLARQLFERYGRNNSLAFAERVSDILNCFLIHVGCNIAPTSGSTKIPLIVNQEDKGSEDETTTK